MTHFTGRMIFKILAVTLLAFAVDSVSVQVKDSAQCNLCKAGLTELQTIAGDPKIKDILTLAKNYLCKSIPIENCDDWVSEQLSYLAEDVNKIDPAAACTKMKACSTDRYMTSQVGETKPCAFCEFVGEEVRSLLNDKTVEDVSDAVIAMCHSELPAVLATGCEAVVKEYGTPFIERFFKDLDVTEACAEIGLCSEDVRHMIQASEPFQVLSKALKESDGCKACKDGVIELKMVLSNPDTLDLMHIGVKEMCALVKTPLCELLANTAIDNIVKELIKKLDAEKMCSGLCVKNENIIAVESPSLEEKPLCEACEDALGEIKKVANDKETQEMIKDLAQVICGHISIPFCQTVFDKLIKSQVDHLKNINVKGTCAMMPGCGTKEAPVTGNDLGNTCSQCTFIADELLTVLRNADIDSLIKEGIDEVCSVIPIPNCAAQLDKYVDLVFDFIKKLDGKSLCSMIGMCGSKTLQEVPVENLKDTCSICTLVADELLTALKNKDIENLVKEGVEEICSIIPIPNCASTVDSYVDMLFGMLKNMDGKTLCSMVGMCNSVKTVEVPVEDLKDSCSMCTMVANEALTLIKTEESLVKASVEEICSVLPIPNCKATIDSYIDMIFGIINSLDGKSLCTMIGMCGSEKIQEIPMKDLKDTCSICTLVADELLTALKNKDIENLVKEGVEEICSIIPIPNCASTVDSYVDMLFGMLKNMDGKTLCSMVGMCDSVKTVEVPVEDLKGSCSMCTMVANEALTLIKTEESLVKASVEEICSVLPIPNCKATIDSYIDMLFGIIDSLDGKSLCTMIGMCQGKLTQVSLPQSNSVEKIICPECKMVVNIILKGLLIPANWNLIEFSLDEACLYLPISNCKSTVHEILSKIHDYINQQDATSVCSQVGLCSSNKKAELLAIHNNVGDVCSECSWVVNELVSIVTNPEIDGIVKSLAETFCAIVPIQGCANIADSFIDMVVDEIKMLDGKTLCGYVGLC